MSSILTKLHVFETSLAGIPRSSNLGSQPPMKSIRPLQSTRLFSKFSRRFSFKRFLLVALYFLKIILSNFFQNIPASCSVCVLYTHQVPFLCKLPSWDTQELELGYPTAIKVHVPFVGYKTFSQNFTNEFLLNVSC